MSDIANLMRNTSVTIVVLSVIVWSLPVAGHTPLGYKIFYVQKDGSNLTRVSDEAMDSAFSPVWSPDGRHILYIACNAQLYVASVPGLVSRRVKVPLEVQIRGPAWSPKGTHVAFSGSRVADTDTKDAACGTLCDDLYLMKFEGADEVMNLTDTPSARESTPSWSPDGGRIAFTTVAAGLEGNVEICVMDTDGLNAYNLTSHDSLDKRPFWSPDGTRIAFESRRYGNSEIFVANVNGGEAVNVSNHPAEDQDPAWSPDGKEIAFVSNRDGNWEVYRMDLNGSRVTRVTFDEADDLEPGWSPDGKRICFTSNRGESAFETLTRWMKRTWGD